MSLHDQSQSIATKASAATKELQHVLTTQGINPNLVSRLARLQSHLSSLSAHARSVVTVLGTPTAALCPELQDPLAQALARCDDASGVLGKQLMRVQADNVNLVRQDSLAQCEEFAMVSSKLFAALLAVLPIDAKTQLATWDKLTGAVLTDRAEWAANSVVTGGGILPDYSDAEPKDGPSESFPSTTGYDKKAPDYDQPPTSSPASDAPPPYVPSSSSPAQASSSSSRPPAKKGGFSSFTKSFKALASGLLSKPEPLSCALCEAVTRGDVEQAKGLLGQGAKVNGRNDEGNTPLQCAILADNEQTARVVLDAGADIKASGWSSTPPLFFAALHGRTAIARLILDRGANVHARSMAGQSYIADVVAKPNLDGVRFLLENGAEATATNMSGEAIVASAVTKKDMDMTRLLLKHGADVNSKNLSGTPISCIAVDGSDWAMADLLLAKGANANSKDLTGNPMLAKALSKRQVDFAIKLLEHGADANSCNLTGQPVLITVLDDEKLSRQQHLAMLETLLERGASANTCDWMWQVPVLCQAMERNDTKLVALFLKHGANAMPALSHREPLLLMAMDRGADDQVKLLLEHGADPHRVDKHGRTAFNWAQSKHPHLVPLLSQYGKKNPDEAPFAKVNRGLVLFKTPVGKDASSHGATLAAGTKTAISREMGEEPEFEPEPDADF